MPKCDFNKVALVVLTDLLLVLDLVLYNFVFDLFILVLPLTFDA